MPPVRSSHKPAHPEASTSKPKKVFKKHRKPRTADHEDQQNTPGVQKIKSALRQTRRLLAKENLAADVKVEAERRLKALEHELSQAELARKERQMAVRYHKIKFFEKKKVLRKIKQCKAQLEATESKRDKAKLSAELLEQRINLNYILHYPKTEKYISLFPPEVRKGSADAGEDHQPESDATSAQREAVRQQTRERMEKGELPSEPETQDVPRTHKKSVQTKAQQKGPSSAQEANEIEEDEFFGSESEGEESG